MKIFRRFGSVCTWGSGKYLGHNKPPGTHVKTPTIIQNRGNGEKFDEDIIALSEGLNHCGLVTKTGELYMFGKNDSLQLGSHLEKHSLAPMKIPNIPLIKQVSCGTNFTISLSREGEVYSWGCAGSKGIFNRLFKSSHMNYLGYHCKDDTAVPRKIESIEETIIQIASGDSHSLALSQEGSVYAWGSNLSGAVGDELMNFHLQTPIKIAFFENLAEKVVKICAGNQSSAALTQNGKVYVWGNNENYEIGVDDEELIGFHHIWTPSLIKISESNFIKDICLGENSLMMLSNIDIIFVSGFKI